MAIKTDELFLKINDQLKNLNDRITPDVILSVALLNGFILGFITTGYLGNSTISVQSFTFVLFVWQFAIICFFSAPYVSMTTEYMHKFGMSGVIGYAFQWQTFGMYVVKYEPDIKMEPIVDNGFGVFLFFYTCFLVVKYCFSGNVQTKSTTKKYELE